MSKPREPFSALRAEARSDLSPASNRRADPSASDPRVEDYLDRICAPLVGQVPYERRQELRAEMLAHLESLVEAYQELGEEKEQAVTRAIEQLGDPGAVAHASLAVWGSPRSRRTASPFWRQFLTALGCFGCASSMSIALLILAQPNWSVGVLWGGLFTIVSLLLPAVAGMATGLLSPIRHPGGIAWALAVVVLHRTIALPFILGATPRASDLLLIGWLGGLLWFAAGDAAAWYGSRLRNRSEEATQALTV